MPSFNRRRMHAALPRLSAICSGAAIIAFAATASPDAAHACACGCGVFDVGTSSLFPSGSGGTVYLEYDYVNQNHNWSGESGAPSVNNPDKKIQTNFITAGLQYMFNREWGVMAQVPYWDRRFETAGDSGAIASFEHAHIADMRLMGVYTGFSPDMSTGVTFGLKLPTGDFTYANFDRDTQIGTGSTDTLLGAFHMGRLTDDNMWTWFVQGTWDQPFLYQGGYHPGRELNAATGIYYHGWSVGDVKIVPVLQVIGNHRWKDTGPAADPVDTGYTRFLAAPGVEVDVGSARLYVDVEPPVYQNVRGNQLVPSELFKAIVSYSF